MKTKPEEYPLNKGRSGPDVLFTQAMVPGREHFSAGAYGMIDGGGNWHARYFGMHSRFPGHVRVKTNELSMFDVASVTKAVPVALLIFWAVSEGLISLDDKVSSFIPGLKPTTSMQPTIRDLLSYRARIHLDQLEKPYTTNSPGELRELLENAPVTVGSTLHYSNYPPILLVMILKKITGKPLFSLSHDILFHPLRMKATFVPFQGVRDTVANEIGADGWPLCGVVHDEFTRASGMIGAAGLFATCEDLLRVGRFILNRGSHGSKQIIKEYLFDEMSRNEFDTGLQFGLGFGIWDEFASGYDPMEEHLSEMGEHGPKYSEGAIFKNGFGSATIAIFPKIGKAAALLTNCNHPKRHANSQWINRFRHAVIMNLLTGKLPDDGKELWQKR